MVDVFTAVVLVTWVTVTPLRTMRKLGELEANAKPLI